MFSEIIHHIIIAKYTLECTQLNYLLKILLEEHTLESSINKIGQLYSTHSTIGHRFLPWKNSFRHPPPPPPR